MTQIEKLTGSTSASLQAALSNTIATSIERTDVSLLERILDGLSDDGPVHTIEQLEAALGLTGGSLDTIEAVLDESTPQSPAAILLGLFAAIAALAAAGHGHILNTAQPRVRSAGDQLLVDTLRRFISDTSGALTLAVGRAVQNPGSSRSQALQLRRSIGLSSAQIASLDHIRTALLQRQAKQTLERTEAERLDNIESEVALYRRVLSAPQTRMLRKALTEGLANAGIEARLDRHANALRTYRLQAATSHIAHTGAEAGKLIGWQVAQFFGAIPNSARRYWETAGDERVRHTHANVPAMNAQGVALDQPFATPLGDWFTPPLEFGCRCRAVLKKAR